MTDKVSPRDWEALSAYLDQELAPRERVRLESRLQANADLRSALEQLRMTRAVLRSQPKLRAPHNFTLTPEMAGVARRARSAPRAYPFFRLASVLASLLLVFVLLGDFLSSPALLSAEPATVGMVTTTETIQMEEQPLMQKEEVEQMEAPAAAAEAAPMEDRALEGSPEAPRQMELGAAAPSGAAPTLEGTSTPLEAMQLPQPTTEAGMSALAPPGTATAVAGGGAEAAQQPAEIEAEEPAAMAAEAAPAEEVGRRFDWYVLEIALALAAVIAGLAAYLLRPKRRE